MSGVRDANVRVGDFVVVVGLGAIGQIAIQLAKRAGASVVIESILLPVVVILPVATVRISVLTPLALT